MNHLYSLCSWILFNSDCGARCAVLSKFSAAYLNALMYAIGGYGVDIWDPQQIEVECK
jgi:hypothetical protein